jgi:hypothetical protein
MSPEEQYPSADDAAQSRALTIRQCLIEARARVDEGWSRSTYVEVDDDGTHVSVCAVGGIFYVDGLGKDDVEESFLAINADDDLNGQWFVWLAENKLSEVAREAIALLNRVAERRHPEYVPERHQRNWSGALEWINQKWLPPDGSRFSDEGERQVKTEVLTTYDEAIAIA